MPSFICDLFGAIHYPFLAIPFSFMLKLVATSVWPFGYLLLNSATGGVIVFWNISALGSI